LVEHYDHKTHTYIAVVEHYNQKTHNTHSDAYTSKLFKMQVLPQSRA